MAQIIQQVAELDTSNWVRIPYEFTGGKYQLDVNPARLSYCPAVERAGKELGLKFKNTTRDSLNREFIGEKNWFEFLMLNRALGNGTIFMNEFVDYGRLLFSGAEGEIPVYDVSGKQIDRKILKNYFEDIFAVKSPWRAENIDADFKLNENNLEVHKNHIFDLNGNVLNYDSEILEPDTLMENKTPGIDLKDFLNLNHTSQGFPNKKVKIGNLFYWALIKDNNSIARFDADAGRTGLGWGVDCYGGPSGSGSGLGVRAVRRS